MIKKATKNDYEKCVELAKKDKFVKDFVSTSFRWGWENNLYVYKDDEDEKVLGFVQFNLCKRINKSSLYYVYSSPEARGKGIGTKLFNFYLEKSMDKELLYWKVSKKNENALMFYEKFGFKPKLEKEKEFIFLTKKYVSSPINNF